MAAVGTKTAQRISEHGVGIDTIPDEYRAEAMLSGFGQIFDGKRFLFPQSNLARTALANLIITYHAVEAANWLK